MNSYDIESKKMAVMELLLCFHSMYLPNVGKRDLRLWTTYLYCFFLRGLLKDMCSLL
jgi:hypothetical protein